MGSAEDQLDFTSPFAQPAGRGGGAETPLARGSADIPQKTFPQKPKDLSGQEGPRFDFAHPAVVSAEAALREAALALEVSLQESLADGAGDEGYPAIEAAVARSVPPFHACYEGYVQAVVATGETRVACGKGCSHCCSHYVSSVEPFEMIRLHARIRRDAAYPSRLVAFHRRAALFSSLLAGRHDEASDDKALFRYYLRDVPCPFLTSAGECGVYDERPMSCRMFFSQSHPSLCRGKAAASPGNRNFIVEMPEDIEVVLARASALLAGFELSENLFEGLLEANARFGRFDGAP